MRYFIDLFINERKDKKHLLIEFKTVVEAKTFVNSLWQQTVDGYPTRDNGERVNKYRVVAQDKEDNWWQLMNMELN